MTNDIPEESRLTPEEIIKNIFKKLGEQCPHVFTSAHTTYKRDCYFCLVEIEKGAKAQLEKAMDYDPQAEMVGRFIELGWTPPDELDAKIKQAQEDERKRMWQEIPRELLSELKTELSNYSLGRATLAFERVTIKALSEGRDPSQEG